MKMNARTVRAEKIFPLMGVRDNVAISVNGTLTLGWELTLPVAYSCTEGEYDDIIGAFSSAIGILPAWTVVHRQDIFTYEDWHAKGEPAKDFLTRSYEEHFEGRRYLTHRSYLYLSLTTRGLVEKSGSSSGLFGLSTAVKVPTRQDLNLFRTKAKEFIALITASGLIRARLMDDADWLGEGDRVGAIQRVMMLGDESCVMSHVALAPDAVRVKDRTMNCYVIGESDQLPTEISSVSKVEKLSSSSNTVFLSTGAALGVTLDCEHIVNQYIVVPSQDEILHKLDSERKKMTSGISSADNRINSAEIQRYLDDAYANGLVTVLSHTNIMFWGADESLADLSATVSTAIHSMNQTRGVMNLYNTPVLYYAAIPGAACDISKENLMKMELVSALCLGIYETFEKDVPEGGVLQICDRMRNIPLRTDTQFIAQRLDWINNYNLFVVGGSGTGKSFFMNMYTRNLYHNGEQVFIIDVGHSYQGITQVINEETGGADGQYLSWDMEHPLSFNPFIGFTRWLTKEGNLVPDENGVNFVVSLLETIYEPGKGWVSSNEPILKQTVLDFVKYAMENGFSEDNLPTVDDYFSFTGKVVSPQLTKKKYMVGDEEVGTSEFNIKDFRLALKAYSSSGEFAFLLNDKKPKDLFTSRYVVFEVSKLSDVKDRKFYSICILCMMNAFDVKMRSGDTFKNLIIEEAWKAIANETMAPYLKGLWKTARKHSTSCIVVTQELSDIISSDVIKDAILMNSDIRVLLDQQNNRNILTAEENLGDKDIRTMLGLSPKEIDIILSLNRSKNPNYNYKEVFIKYINGHSGVYATEVSPEEALCYESNMKKKEPLLKAAREKGSIIKAIKAATKLQRQAL